MIVDNGTRAHLIIDGVFDGTAGLSRGVVAFIPNRTGRKPQDARGGLLDGAPVRVAVTVDGPICTATVEALT